MMCTPSSGPASCPHSGQIGDRYGATRVSLRIIARDRGEVVGQRFGGAGVALDDGRVRCWRGAVIVGGGDQGDVGEVTGQLTFGIGTHLVGGAMVGVEFDGEE